MFLNDHILQRWVNQYYLLDDTIHNLQQTILAKPTIQYVVLDNFFNVNKLDELISAHSKLSFSEEQDRRGADGSWLPYDGAVSFGNMKSYGAELFYHAIWHKYLLELFQLQIAVPASTEIKLRYHKPYADGFWIHTDSVIRAVVAIMYFNKNWKASDGGLLQLWQVCDGYSPTAFPVEKPSGRLDFLAENNLIRTRTPGGGFSDNMPHDLMLVDQIVPIYNRLFVCNFLNDPAYHSVTPSNGRARTGYVQWLHKG